MFVLDILSWLGADKQTKCASYIELPIMEATNYTICVYELQKRSEKPAIIGEGGKKRWGEGKRGRRNAKRLRIR